MISNKNVANAVGGKTARACDSCIRKRARWYCAADDAFLCQSCDSTVHSANPLARRHERVRLKIASLKSLDIAVSKENSVNSVPSWHQGFTKKARTPRHHGNKTVFSLLKIEEKLRNPIPLVPEVGSDDQISHEDHNDEDQLLYRVPIFDPFVAELCTSTTISNEADQTQTPTTTTAGGGNDTDQTAADANGIESKASSYIHGFLPSEMDLAEFAADVESLLGRGLENESFRMEDLGLVDRKEEKEVKRELSLGSGKVKIENEEKEEELVRECPVESEIYMAKEPPFELSFDYDSATCGEEEEKVETKERDLIKNSINGEHEEDCENHKKINKKKKKRKILLSLDYESVITAWSSQGTSPWTNGNRPDVDPDECWPDCLGICGANFHHPYGDINGIGGGGNPTNAMMGGGREARVSRYREKRRTRLFSKKIRYEVRKLNAEKRPRMKGRFVKRASFAPPPAAAAFPVHTK